MDTLTEIVAGMEPPLRAALAAIRVDCDGAGAEARLSISLFRPPSPAGSVSGYAVTIDTASLPAGVSLTGWERWPDIVRTISMATPMAAQIAALDASGLVGTLDAARFVPVHAADVAAGHHPAARWIVKTHAGSDAERLAWMRTLPHGPKERGA